jgi:hypothetical protein
VDDDDGARFRLVTHYWINSADIDHSVAVFREALGKGWAVR